LDSEESKRAYKIEHVDDLIALPVVSAHPTGSSIGQGAVDQGHVKHKGAKRLSAADLPLDDTFAAEANDAVLSDTDLRNGRDTSEESTLGETATLAWVKSSMQRTELNDNLTADTKQDGGCVLVPVSMVARESAQLGAGVDIDADDLKGVRQYQQLGDLRS
jgi:hypothetical protein